MKIVNPLYDKAFKYLMENEKYASKVLSVILDREVEEVSLQQQEVTYQDEQKQLSLFRLDFKATIREESGEMKTVLIELQKSKFLNDIHRFRNYLGSQYMSGKKERKGDKTPAIYPIITIYLLGYPLEDNPYLAVRSDSTLTDATTHQPIDIKDGFLKFLTHESYVIQVIRLPPERRSRMEKFFTLFNQAWIDEENYILDLEEVPEEFRDIANHLHLPVLDKAFRNQLELEDEVTAEFEKLEEKLKEAIAREEEAKTREEEERRLKEEAKTREEEAKVREKEVSGKLTIAIIGLSQTMNPEQIATVMNLSVEEVQRILLSQ